MRLESFIPDFNPRGYLFWLALISLSCWLLERWRPWVRAQGFFRKQIGQDFFFLIFNAHFVGILLAYPAAYFIRPALAALYDGAGVAPPQSWRLLSDSPFWLQLAVLIVFQDFIEWLVHNALHRVGWLWQFHKLHHSITEMDWLGNFRFHWMEILIYGSVKYFPLAILGVDYRISLAIGVFATLIGHLNHSNVRIDWGPLRYVLNSSSFHIWHHERIPRGGHGVNFAIVFSVWDWLFGTAYLPADRDRPAALGFDGIERFPRGLVGRLVYPAYGGARQATPQPPRAGT